MERRSDRRDGITLKESNKRDGITLKENDRNNKIMLTSRWSKENE